MKLFKVGSIPAMGIASRTYAIKISQWIGAVCSGYKVHRKTGFTTQVDIVDVKKFLKTGRDIFLRTGSLILFLSLATRSATRLDAETRAAHQANRQVFAFTNLFLDVSAITAQSIIPQR